MDSQELGMGRVLLTFIIQSRRRRASDTLKPGGEVSGPFRCIGELEGMRALNVVGGGIIGLMT